MRIATEEGEGVGGLSALQLNAFSQNTAAIVQVLANVPQDRNIVLTTAELLITDEFNQPRALDSRVARDHAALVHHRASQLVRSGSDSGVRPKWLSWLWAAPVAFLGLFYFYPLASIVARGLGSGCTGV